MKNILRNAAAISIGVMLLFAMSNADAQRGRRGGGISFGIRGGFGGPHIGIGFGSRGYYRPYFGGYYGFRYPTIGLNFGYLPYGYFPFYYGPDLYYGYNGVYYRQNDDKYEVVAPPIGAEIPKLPAKAKSIMINNEQYYVMDDVYYKEVIHPDNTKGYQIVGKDGVLNTGQDQNQANRPLQVGDIVDQLPQDCRTVTLNNKKYYVSPDDVYYEESVDNGGTTGYKVVGVPNDQNQDQNQNQNNNNKPQPQIQQQ